MRASSGLHLHTSNRLESLFGELAEFVGKSLGSILQPEIVVVQSVGMGRWLSLRLAETHGICANVQFPFPQKFVSDVFRAALPEMPTTNAFDREVLTWRIMKRLPSLIDTPEFEAVRNYVGGERPELKLFQLSSKIAQVFDQYLAFRPGMILDWDAGKETHWQAILWRGLTNESPDAHQPALGKKLAQTLRNGNVRLAHLPPRVSIFGISTLPRFYLEFVEALATQIEFHLFVMEPTPQWWQHIISPREESKILKRQPQRTAEELHLERGNGLLASMGKLGRDFLGLIGDLEPLEHRESFGEPPGLTTLSQIQQDIFALRDRATEATVLPNDKSIQFHSCHNAMREMEVLHDQMLAMLEDDPGLQPKDIIVMMPDVAAYAPFIEAVFDTPEEEKQRIPFTIADRTARAESGVVDIFLAILDLVGSRFGASSVLNILEAPAVQERFGLAETDLETIRLWIDKAAIRWGIDAAHRAKFDLPAFGQNTWREGLDRLLLGYALPAGGARLFEGILPIDEIEGSLAETLGNFVEFTYALFTTADELQPARTLEEWQTTLRQIVERFFAAADDVERELLQVRRALESLGEISRDAGFDKPVPCEVLLAHLARAFENADSGAGFLVGRVTFCALKPMRSIPFKVVCLVGMNDTAYPRKSTAPGFDLIAQRPQPGDRSTRDDDRYLFLEALLSARATFYLSYIGQSIRDNSPLPPSVLVSELLDYLGELRHDKRVTRHRLQPFNPAYFQPNENGLFSYSAENCRAANVSRETRLPPPPFVARPIAEPEEEWKAVDLEKLIKFFSHPARFLLRERLGIQLPNDGRLPEDREPFELERLAEYHIGQRLLAKGLEGAELAGEELLVRAAGQLPPGPAGEAKFHELCGRAEKFGEIVRQWGAKAGRNAAAIDLTFDAWKLTGRVDCLTSGDILHYRLATLKAKDMVRVWISHLARNCTAGASATLIAEDVIQVYPPVAQNKSRELLRELLEIYWRGLREPLPFFPQTSYTFALHTLEPNGRKEPRKEALKIWAGDRFSNGYAESDDAYLQLAFRNVETPLDEAWEKLALKIFRALIAGRAEEVL